MAETQKLHVAMLPWLAFGHIIPFLETAKILAKKGHRVSFISTPRNIKRLPELPSSLASSIQLVSINLPHIDNLPPNAEASIDVSYSQMPFLRKAYDGLRDPVARFLETSAPDWIVHDYATYWVPPIAAKLGISRALLFTFSACCLAFFGPQTTSSDREDNCHREIPPECLTVPPSFIPFPTNVAFRLYEAKQIVHLGRQDESGITEMSRGKLAISGTQVLLNRTCVELEGEWLHLAEKFHDKPVVPIGLLPPCAEEQAGGESWQTIDSWLKLHAKESVVYVALGSEVIPSQENITELAHGLESSGLPFFWVLRSWHGSFGLPDGFEERVKGRGLVWRSWVPQFKVLSHDSVGAFLTHCGWGSIIEAIHSGCALTMLPFLGDQGLNARVAVEKKMGLEIPRNEEDGSFTRNSVAETLRLVMAEEGKIYRERVKEMGATVRAKDLPSQYTDNFIDYLIKYRP